MVAGRKSFSGDVNSGILMNDVVDDDEFDF